MSDEAELTRALAVPGALGVNNRDLRTLAMERGRAERILSLAPPDRPRVAESGYSSRAEMEALARAGVGTLRIVDRDYVEESNLQRQTLFDEADAAASLPKAVAAERKLRQINSDVRVEGIVTDFDGANAEELVRDFQVIVDGTDNFEARYLVNDVAVKLGIPWVYGAVVGSYAMTLTVLPGRGPCLACVFPEAPRGLLYHIYRLDDDGTILDARIVPPTSQNQRSIEDDLRGVVTEAQAEPEEKLRHRCEQTIRNHDPCISCATHFLKLEVERT